MTRFMSVVLVVLTALACRPQIDSFPGSPTPTAAVSTISTATPGPPVTFLEQPEMQAWITVKAALLPGTLVLRPTWLPSRFQGDPVMIEYAYVLGAEPRYRVGYRASDGLIAFGAGAVNAGPATSTRTISVRGVDASYYTTTTFPDRGIEWIEGGLLYSIQARGVSEDELLKVAAGVAP